MYMVLRNGGVLLLYLSSPPSNPPFSPQVSMFNIPLNDIL